eukprot:TRINITY_DN25516_c0_g1_i1.p1 TRINITY_DN25516_c0_g1~~TRINITY_DN25516_c0_g1_i1.p1  ORF type:complete len:354 (-),score=63.35 TRINITY_DN25516_c0_g1_i1:10-1071(-)
MAVPQPADCPCAFDPDFEGFDSYMQRCIDHMSIDFHRACGSFNRTYLQAFKDTWCCHDVGKRGMLPVATVLALAEDLLAQGFESWELSDEDQELAECLSRGGLVCLRDLCLWAERDIEYVVGPSGQEINARMVAHGPRPQRLPGEWSQLGEDDVAHGVAHLAVDMLSCRLGGGRLSGSGGQVHQRATWYKSAWAEAAGSASELPWSGIEELLRQAVETKGFSRFASCQFDDSGEACWGHTAALEAAAMFSVRSRSQAISFLTFCSVAEAPEPFVHGDALRAAAAASSAFAWSPDFHREVIVRRYPRSRFHKHVKLLLFSASSACGLTIPQPIWLRVISLLERDLEAECDGDVS